MAPVSPRQKSRKSCPSTQVRWAPCASRTNRGKGFAWRAIQFIGHAVEQVGAGPLEELAALGVALREERVLGGGQLA